MPRPRALDLFCGAGGAAMGLHRAGFDVVGVDIKRQPRYPFPFIQGDALHPPLRLEDFDLVWASPPCQGYTSMTQRRNRRREDAHRLIPSVREMLSGRRSLWVIENVPNAIGSMKAPFALTGEMFGLKTHRRRLFEASFFVMSPSRTVRRKDQVPIYGPPDGRRLWDRKDGSQSRAWKFDEGRAAMDMPWADEDGVREAIPPAYSEHIGRYAMMALGRDA